MKRFVWVVALFLLACVPVAWSDAIQGGEIRGAGTDPIKMVTVTEDTNSAGDFSTGSFILGFKVTVSAASGQCTLYDSATLAGGSNSNVIDEIIEPTDEDSSLQMWPFPYEVVTAVSVDVTNVRACTIYYQ